MAESRGKKASSKKPDPAVAEQRYAPECYACPIGSVSMAVQKVRPDANEHLFRAGRELVLALRSLLDGMNDALSTMEDRGKSATRGVQKIEIRRD
jgi:hypothetical protein